MSKNGFGHGKKRKKRQADGPKDSTVKLEPIKYPQFYPAKMQMPKPLSRGSNNDKKPAPFDGKIDMFMDMDMDSGEELIKNKTKLEENGPRLRSAKSKKDDFVYECEKNNSW